MSNINTEVTHKKILFESAKLFLRKGFDHVSMDEIAKSSQHSKQTVYKHFGSKNNLFEKAFAFKCDELYKISSGIFYPSPNPGNEAFHCLFLRVYEFINSCHFLELKRACDNEARHKDYLLYLFYEAGVKNVLIGLVEHLNEQISLEMLCITDTRLASIHLFSMIENSRLYIDPEHIKPNLTRGELYDYSQVCITIFKKNYR